MTDRGDDDARLVARIARGDDAAFTVIYDRYLPLVLRWSLRETGNRDVAADLAAETFAAALIASPRLSERWRAVNLSCDGGGWWLFSVDALAYLGPRPLACRVGDKMVDWSFRWKRLRPLGLSRTATLIAWEPAGLRELAGRLSSVMDGLDGKIAVSADGLQGGRTRPGPYRRELCSAWSRGVSRWRVAAEHGMLLMLCDQCALERCLADGEIGAARPAGTVEGVRVGCFPDLYAALAGDPPDHVITL